MPSELAMKIALAITAEYSVGNSSVFCDEGDWDSATDEELAELIDKVLSTKAQKDGK
jgi:hypothetical protein